MPTNPSQEAPLRITPAMLANAFGIKVSPVLLTLLRAGQSVTINQPLAEDQIAFLLENGIDGITHDKPPIDNGPTELIRRMAMELSVLCSRIDRLHAFGHVEQRRTEYAMLLLNRAEAYLADADAPLLGGGEKVQLADVPGHVLGGGYPDFPADLVSYEQRAAYQRGIAHARAVDLGAATAPRHVGKPAA